MPSNHLSNSEPRNPLPSLQRNRPIGITMGCPVGIGPEVIVRFLAARAKGEYPPVILGDMGMLQRCARELGLKIQFYSWHPGQEIGPEGIAVLAVSNLPAEQLTRGRPSPETARVMAQYVEKAVQLLLAGDLAAMVTCPITKQGLQEAGYRFPGHTEMLAALSGATDYAMMMAGRKLCVTLVTIHQALAAVPKAVTSQAVLRMIEITGRALREDFGLRKPRLAVAGLNPHAGEGGLFGKEEQQAILPAVQEARAGGWQVSGPLPPDTVFHKAAAGHYDAVVAMYHDQGLIPFKLLHFEDGVNVTLGLPFVRTSVDHGTAYDIAGQGVASPASLAAAYELAARIAGNRQRHQRASGRS